MNELKRQVIRGFYKEAGVQNIIKNIKDYAKNVGNNVSSFAKSNQDVLKRGGIDLGAAVAGMGLRKGVDALQGKKTSLLDYLVSGGLSVAAAEGAQYAVNKIDDLTQDRDSLASTVQDKIQENTDNMARAQQDQAKAVEQAIAETSALYRNKLNKTYDYVRSNFVPKTENNSSVLKELSKYFKR